MRLLVVRIRDTDIGKGCLCGIYFLLQFSQATSACRRDDQFIRAVVLARKQSERLRIQNEKS